MERVPLQPDHTVICQDELLFCLLDRFDAPFLCSAPFMGSWTLSSRNYGALLAPHQAFLIEHVIDPMDNDIRQTIVVLPPRRNSTNTLP